jgi:DNA-binding XRE family transcriptional regulator
MADVVEIAKERRATLVAEIGTLDGFIRMAEALVQDGRGLGRVPVMTADADHFAFNDEASVNEDELVLTDVLPDEAAPAGALVGQRMRHRRWMLGITQQQLGELVGIKFEQIQKYEAGANRISASTMRNIAEALEAPVSYFLENSDGHVPGTGEARGGTLTDR